MASPLGPSNLHLEISSHENKICISTRTTIFVPKKKGLLSLSKNKCNSSYAPGQVHVQAPCSGEEPEFHLFFENKEVIKLLEILI